MRKLCPYCGIETIETKYDGMFCKNCGLIEEGEREGSEEDTSYIG